LSSRNKHQAGGYLNWARRRDTLHHSSQAMTSAGVGRAAASPYAVSMRKASHAGEARGAGGQWYHHPRGAIATDSASATGHRSGRPTSATAASIHQTRPGGAAPLALRSRALTRAPRARRPSGQSRARQRQRPASCHRLRQLKRQDKRSGLTRRRRVPGGRCQLRLPKRDRRRRRISDSSSPIPERRAGPLRPPKRAESDTLTWCT